MGIGCFLLVLVLSGLFAAFSEAGLIFIPIACSEQGDRLREYESLRDPSLARKESVIVRRK